MSNVDIYGDDILRIHDERVKNGLIQIELYLPGSVQLVGIPIEFFYGEEYFSDEGGVVSLCGCHTRCALLPADRRTR